MKIYHVVAMARNRVIGKDNKLPWHFFADLKAFKALTTGQTVIMGRKTFESIGRPLPHRENFVLSRRTGLTGDGVVFFSDPQAALEAVRTEKAFVIGGAEIYALTAGSINGIYLTRIDADYEGDAFYPGIPEGFEERSRKTLQEEPLIETLYYEIEKKPSGSGPGSARHG